MQNPKNTERGRGREKPYTFRKYYGITKSEYNKTFVYTDGKPVLPIRTNGHKRGCDVWKLYSGTYVVIDVISPIWIVRRASLYGVKMADRYPKYELFIYCLTVDSKQRRVNYKVLGTYYINDLNEINKFTRCETEY